MKGKDRGFEILGYVVLGMLTLACIVPFWLLISGSLTDELTITTKGYSLIPAVFGTDAYGYIFNHYSLFLRSMTTSICVTVVGTILHTALAATMAYPLSKQELPGRGVLSFIVILTLLLNGGLVPTYLVYTQMLHIKNTFFALLVPTLLLNGYNIILMRNFFTASIPGSMIEAARIDGASEWTIFIKTVIPISKPMLTTIALMAGMSYWNDWNNGLYYITEEKRMGLQNILNSIIKNAQFLSAHASSGVSVNTVIPVESLRMAVALVAAIPMVIAYICLQKYFIAGMTMGAVKE
ncbi:MAG: carbohydrate ABC transporter permease [Lachnospiraceae bacterium]|nr:carbohydrate ABC transporter permease [Lachnospiraceae bacterium]